MQAREQHGRVPRSHRDDAYAQADKAQWVIAHDSITHISSGGARGANKAVQTLLLARGLRVHSHSNHIMHESFGASIVSRTHPQGV
jgi:hypothetical protein